MNNLFIVVSIPFINKKVTKSINRFELMNASAESVNALQAKLDQQLEIHKSFVINFAENLALAKKNLNDKELKNAEQFYLIMHRGKFSNPNPNRRINPVKY